MLLDIIQTLINWGFPPVNIYNALRRMTDYTEDEVIDAMIAYGIM